MAKKKGLSPAAPEETPLNSILTRKGVYVVLQDAPDIELAGPLAKGMINVFIATSGSGKSLLAFLISWKELKAGSFDCIFYIDIDNPHSVFKDRYSAFPELENMFYFTEYALDKLLPESYGLFPVEKAWGVLQELSESEYVKNSLVVIDSLQNFCDYNDLKELKKFFRLLKKITNAGGTVLVLHHKSSKQESPSFKGLSYIKDASDVLWEVTPDIKRTGEINSFKLTCTKNRSTTNFVSFVVAFSTDTGTVTYDQNVLFQEEIPVKEAILVVLQKQNGMKQLDLVQAVKEKAKVNEKKIRSVLAKLVALDLVHVSTGKKNAKLYSANYNALEPGYFDDLEDEDLSPDDKVALPF